MANENDWERIATSLGRSLAWVKNTWKRVIQREGVTSIKSYSQDEFRKKISGIIEKLKAKVEQIASIQSGTEFPTCLDIPEENTQNERNLPRIQSREKCPESSKPETEGEQIKKLIFTESAIMAGVPSGCEGEKSPLYLQESELSFHKSSKADQTSLTKTNQ